jgi:hypothetical protein
MTEKLMETFSENGLTVAPVQNTYHVTFFQMRIETSVLETLADELETIVGNFRPLNVKVEMSPVLTESPNYVFWDVKSMSNEKSNVQKIHEEIVNKISPLRSKNLMKRVAKDVENSTLSDEKLENIEKYGITWSLPGPNFHPHSTVLYNTGNYSELINNGQLVNVKGLLNVGNLSVHEPFGIECLAIGQLGFYGNVLKVLRKISLND